MIGLEPVPGLFRMVRPVVQEAMSTVLIIVNHELVDGWWILLLRKSWLAGM